MHSLVGHFSRHAPPVFTHFFYPCSLVPRWALFRLPEGGEAIERTEPARRVGGEDRAMKRIACARLDYCSELVYNSFIIIPPIPTSRSNRTASRRIKSLGRRSTPAVNTFFVTLTHFTHFCCVVHGCDSLMKKAFLR